MRLGCTAVFKVEKSADVTDEGGQVEDDPDGGVVRDKRDDDDDDDDEDQEGDNEGKVGASCETDGDEQVSNSRIYSEVSSFAAGPALSGTILTYGVCFLI